MGDNMEVVVNNYKEALNEVRKELAKIQVENLGLKKKVNDVVNTGSSAKLRSSERKLAVAEGAAAQARSDCTDAKAELEKEQKAHADLEVAISEDTTEAELLDSMEKLEGENSRLMSELETEKISVSELRASVEAAEAAQASAEAALASQTNAIADGSELTATLEAQLETQKQERAEVVTALESQVAKLESNIEVSGNEHTEAMNTLQSQVESSKETLSALESGSGEASVAVAEAQSALETEKAAHAEVVAALDAHKAAHGEVVSTLEAAQRQLDGLMNQQDKSVQQKMLEVAEQQMQKQKAELQQRNEAQREQQLESMSAHDLESKMLRERARSAEDKAREYRISMTMALKEKERATTALESERAASGADTGAVATIRAKLDEKMKEADKLSAELEEVNQLLAAEATPDVASTEDYKNLERELEQLKFDSEAEISKLNMALEFSKKKGNVNVEAEEDQDIAAGHEDVVEKYRVQKEELVAEMNETCNVAKVELSVVREKTSAQVHALEEQMKGLLDEKEALQQEAQELQRKLDPLEKTIEEQTNKISSLERNLTEAEGRISKLDLDMRQLKIDKADAVQQKKEEIEAQCEVQAKLDKREDENKIVLAASRAEKAANEAAGEEVAELKALLEPLRYELEEERTKVKELTPRAETAERDLETALASLSEANEKIAVFDETTEDFKEELRSLKDQTFDLEIVVGTMKDEKEKLKSEMQSLQQQMVEVKQEADEAAKAKLSVEMDLQGACIEIEEAQKACQQAVADHEETKLEMADMQEKYDEARLSVKKVEGLETKVKQKEKEIKAVQKKIEQLSEARILAEAGAAKANADMEQKESEFKSLNEKLTKAEALTRNLIGGDAEQALQSMIVDSQMKLDDTEELLRIAQKEISVFQAAAATAAAIEADVDVEPKSAEETMDPNARINILTDKVNEMDIDKDRIQHALDKEKHKVEDSKALTNQLFDEIETLKGEQQLFSDQSANLMKEKAQAEIEFASMRMQIEDKQKVAANLLDKLEAAEAEVLEMKRICAAAEAKLAEKDVEAADTNEADPTAVLKDELEETKSHLAAKTEQCGLLFDQIDKIEKDIQSKDANIKKLSGKIEAIAPAVDALEDTKKELAELKEDSASEAGKLKKKLEDSEKQKQGYQKDLPRLQNQVETYSKQIESLEAEIKVIDTKLEAVLKETVEAKEERDTFKLQNDRNAAKLQALESGSSAGGLAASAATAKLEANNDDLKMKLTRAQRELDDTQKSCQKYRVLAEETDKERNAKLVKNATKLQALHRGGTGRARAAEAKKIGYGGLQANDVAKASAKTGNVLTEMAEEERYIQRALKRKADSKSDKKRDSAFTTKWSMIVTKMKGDTASFADDLAEKIVVMKASAWSVKFMF